MNTLINLLNGHSWVAGSPLKIKDVINKGGIIYLKLGDSKESQEIAVHDYVKLIIQSRYQSGYDGYVKTMLDCFTTPLSEYANNEYINLLKILASARTSEWLHGYLGGSKKKRTYRLISVTKKENQWFGLFLAPTNSDTHELFEEKLDSEKFRAEAVAEMNRGSVNISAYKKLLEHINNFLILINSIKIDEEILSIFETNVSQEVSNEDLLDYNRLFVEKFQKMTESCT